MPGANQPQLTRVLAQLVRNSFQTQHYLCSKSLFHYCSCGEEVARRGGKRRDAQPVRHQAASQWWLAGMSRKHTCHVLRGLSLFCLWIRDIRPCLSLLGMKFTASLPLIPASPPQMSYPQLYQKPLFSCSLGKSMKKHQYRSARKRAGTWERSSHAGIGLQDILVVQMALFDCPSSAS